MRIRGSSMIPHLNPNDIILVWKFIFKKKIKIDDVITFRKDNRVMIKRVFEIDENGSPFSTEKIASQLNIQI